MSLDTGVDISAVNGAGAGAGSALAADKLTLVSGASVTMTAAQNNSFDSTVTAAGTETITLSDASSASGIAEVERYVLAAGAQSFTLGASGQNVTLDSTGSSGSVAISTGTLTSVTGTLDDGTGNDTIALTLAKTGVDISSANTTDVDSIALASGISATMTIAQHALITSAAGNNTVTLSDAGTVIGNAAPSHPPPN